MNISLQELYWIVMMAFGLIATGINIVLYVRNKPDKIKAAIQSAIEPVVKRLEVAEINYKTQGQQIAEQGKTLTRIEENLRHVPSDEQIRELQNRLTDLVKDTSELRGAANKEGLQLDRVLQFLLSNKG